MNALQFINDQMGSIGIPYEFGQWSSEISYPYYVGEKPSPEAFLAEDGSRETTIIVTGFHRGNVIDLERDKSKIESHFDPINGLRSKTDSGSIAVFFNGAFYVPTGEADLKKIQINLLIKEWKGSI